MSVSGFALQTTLEESFGSVAGMLALLQGAWEGGIARVVTKMTTGIFVYHPQLSSI